LIVSEDIIMNITTPIRIAAATVLIAALGACAYPGQLQTGTTVSEATSKYGAPVVDRPLASGGRRLIWTTQPLGQYAWRADADAGGTIRTVTQVLSTNEFDRLSVGEWNKDRLLGEFGPPAEVSTVGFNTSTEVWSWRYKESDVFPYMMYAYFDNAGRMIRHHKGPDPMYDAKDSASDRQ
jgi:hypothetical protein